MHEKSVLFIYSLITNIIFYHLGGTGCMYAACTYTHQTAGCFYENVLMATTNLCCIKIFSTDCMLGF